MTRSATELLSRRLIACAQTIGPITSRYWWQGSINQSEEWLFLCKTTPDLVADVVDCVRALHPYDTPEIVASTITDGLESYIDWIVAETHAPPSTARS